MKIQGTVLQPGLFFFLWLVFSSFSAGYLSSPWSLDPFPAFPRTEKVENMSVSDREGFIMNPTDEINLRELI